MRLSVDDALGLILRMFPNQTAVIEDGCDDYLVGVVEGPDEAIIASFRFLFGREVQEGIEVVNEIQIGSEGKFCGTVASPDPGNVNHRGAQDRRTNMVPIDITRIDSRADYVWGYVGDYEVCVGSSLIRNARMTVNN